MVDDVAGHEVLSFLDQLETAGDLGRFGQSRQAFLYGHALPDGHRHGGKRIVADDEKRAPRADPHVGERFRDSLGGKTFYAIPDGSYLFIDSGREELRGEAYRIREGILTRISSENDVVPL